MVSHNAVLISVDDRLFEEFSPTYLSNAIAAAVSQLFTVNFPSKVHGISLVPSKEDDLDAVYHLEHGSRTFHRGAVSGVFTEVFKVEAGGS